MLSFFSSPEKDRVTKAIIPARRRRGCRGGSRGTKSAIQSRGDRRDLFVLKSFQHNRFKTPKLSKLQRYILLEAVKSLSGLAQRAEKANELRQGAVAKGLSKPGLKPVRPSDLSHITRSYILDRFLQTDSAKVSFPWLGSRSER